MSASATPTSIVTLLRERARAAPDVVAHRTSAGDSLTYREWEARAAELARHLEQAGMRPGHRVGLRFSSRGWCALAVAYVAVHACCGVAVLVSDRAAPAELEEIVELAGCAAVLGDDEGWPPPTDAWNFHGVSCELPPGLVVGDLPADVIYTSGSTGRPRGIACPQGNITYEASFRGGAIPWKVPGGMCIHAHPPSGAAGQARITAPLVAGVPLYSLEAFDPRALCDAVEAHAIPHVSLVPSMAVALAEWPHVASHRLDVVEVVSFGSAPLPTPSMVALARVFPSAALVNQYSATEALPARIRGRFDPARPDVVGRPDHDTEVEIRDVASGEVLPVGTIGEVWLRVPGAPSRSYYGEQERLATPDGWVRMGDLGRLTDDGELVLVDRLKNVINRGGVLIAPLEVERALAEHPAVVEAGVSAVPHPVLGEEVAAQVVAREPIAERDLQRFLADRLAFAKIPKRIDMVERLPRTANGKIDRARLTADLCAEADDTAAAAGRLDEAALLGAAWDAEYLRGRYVDEPPITFLDAIGREARRTHPRGHGLYVGCGNGRNLVPLVEAGLRLDGLDVSPVAIEQARARLGDERVRLFVGDFASFEPPRSYDYLVALQVFQHGTRLVAHDYFRRARALLVPGGQLFVRVNSVSTQLVRRHRILEQPDDGGLTIRYEEGPKQGLTVHFFSRGELERCAEWGFEQVGPLEERHEQRRPPLHGHWSQWELILRAV